MFALGGCVVGARVLYLDPRPGVRDCLGERMHVACCCCCVAASFLRLKMIDFCAQNPGHHGIVSLVPKCKDTKSVHTAAKDSLLALETLLAQTAMSKLASANLKHMAAQCLEVRRRSVSDWGCSSAAAC